MRYLLSLLTVALMISTAEARQPFAGKWRGGPATCEQPFVFTDKTYRPPGGDVMTIQKVVRKGRLFELRFKDNYAITLSNVSPKSMGWFSEVSGDGFDLTRCR